MRHDYLLLLQILLLLFFLVYINYYNITMIQKGLIEAKVGLSLWAGIGAWGMAGSPTLKSGGKSYVAYNRIGEY